ncbi:MAG: sigma-54-dependent Fis family transcriptional regulator [Planctomycetes bacterium]|nr:sigma-54-dependent Fis family transcriptional regulator [Planctomycetota bacterium]MBI3847327.1 sigma-54-dependent Fis family transcriptional regulator [Planctomycetota bacterium]
MNGEKILIVDDDPQQAQMLKKILGLEGWDVRVVTSGLQALEAVRAGEATLVLSDLRMPDLSGYDLFRQVREINPEVLFIIVTAYGTIETAVKALKAGVFDYIQKPINASELIAIFEKAREFRRLRKENVELKQRIREEKRDTTIIGAAPIMDGLMEQVEMAAATDATILIHGESGTGKELVANYVHYHGHRADGPFIKVNCAAIPDNLLEDELFGHERGAFTGAALQRKGRFERAHTGTLFLDEIAELPLHLQVKILRVLQEREFERLGGSDVIRVDVRLIVATNRQLESLVEAGTFREDLFYRINVIPLRIPPLRERREDIPLLANHFLVQAARRNGKGPMTISEEARQILINYAWPGNVRELENAIERAVVLGRGGEIRAEDLSFFRPREPGNDSSQLVEKLLGSGVSLPDLERQYLDAGMRRANGNQSQAAKILGVSRRTLQYRLQKWSQHKGSKKRVSTDDSGAGGI